MDPKIIGMFQRFASLIGLQLDSELKHEQSESALRDARAASELREQFIAILGHDLRNPLQAVTMTSALLEARAVDPATKELATRISTNARRMSRLIDDILDFARAKLGGGIGVSIDEGAQVNAALIEVVRELQDGHPDRAFVVDIRARCAVRCDISRIQQLTSNLVGNALTHGDPARPVEVSAHTDANEFFLSVFNEGEPIPEAIQAKIFEPFWRRAIGSNREGLGLGLSICSQIVRAHSGTLSVTSTKESGTTFTARLPLRSGS
jgi:signal transduction histidine kinase